MRYVDFYKQFGARKISDIFSPKVFNAIDIMLPKYSTLYLFNIDLDIQTPKKEGLLFRAVDIVSKTIPTYDGDTIGTFREIPNRTLDYIKKCKENESRINFPKNNSYVVKNTTVLVKNFYGLNSFYKYTSNPLLPYWRFYNILSTVLSETNKELERNIFIPIKIEADMKYTSFRILMDKKITSGLLSRLESYDILTMFELWKMFDVNKHEESLFSIVKPDKLKNVNFVLKAGKSCSIINMEVLLSTISEFSNYMGKISTESGIDYEKEYLNYLSDVLDITYERASKIFSEEVSDINNPELTTEGIYNYKINKLPIKTLGKLVYLMFKKISYSNVIEEKDVPTVKLIEDDIDYVDDENIDKEIEELEVDDIAYESNDEVNDEDIDPEGEIINSNDIDSLNIDLSSEINTLKDAYIPIKSDVKITKKIESLKDSGLITKTKQDKYTKMVEEQGKIPLKVNNKEIKLKDVIEYKHSFDIKEKELEIKESKIIKDKDSLKNTMVGSTKKYIQEDHQVMLIKTLMSVQNADFIVSDIKIQDEENILGKTSQYSLEVTSLDGIKTTLTTILPKLEDDGTYMLSGNNYIMRRQRADIPIRKINYNEVALSSYYGKLFITRGNNKNNDLGYWLRTQIIKNYNNGLISDLVTTDGKEVTFDKILPEDYNIYGRYLVSFKYGEYEFNFKYTNREKYGTKTNFNRLEAGGVILGKKGDNPIVIRFDNTVHEYKDGKFYILGTMEEILNIDMTKAPKEFVTVKIFKTYVPIVLLLGYYYGLEKLLKLYKVPFYYEKHNVRIDKEKYIEVKFSEDKLVIKKGIEHNVLINGLLTMSNETKYIKRLNNKNDFETLFNLLNFSLLVKNEITLLDNMFIDPITIELLKLFKLPETFRGLLIKTIELLMDNHYTNPRSVEGTTFKGYERFSGFLYKELVSSIRDQKNRSTFGRSKINLNPYNIIKKLNEDSTTMLVNDINPIANLKQYDDVTYLGALFGRSKESMSKSTRQYDVDDIGIISEANKDSGDVGISAYVSSSPNVVSTLGVVKSLDVENTSWSTVLSTSAMIAPFAINDDTKRLVFSGIQNEHVIPTLNMNIPYVRTPHDVLVANKIQSKYAQVAENDGVVTMVTKDKVTVKYDGVKPYTKDYKLYSWYSKVESNTTYKHTIISNVVKGEKVSKDDILVYDSAFFTPDVYDKTRVVYIQSTLLNMAFIDDIDTYEDSTSLSYETSELMGISSIKIKSIQLTNEDNVLEVIGIGDKIEPTTTLLTITNQIVDLDGLDEESIEVLKNMNSFSPKAKYKGFVDDIVVYYNCDVETLSPTLKELVKVSDQKLMLKTGFTGKVNSSYSIKGKPLLDGDIEIKIYLSTKDDMSIADKMIWGNQMKCTVGSLFKTITTFDSKEKVDATFSSMSVNKRITPSMIKMGILSSCCKKIEQDALNIYFGK